MFERVEVLKVKVSTLFMHNHHRYLMHCTYENLNINKITRKQFISSFINVIIKICKYSYMAKLYTLIVYLPLKYYLNLQVSFPFVFD